MNSTPIAHRVLMVRPRSFRTNDETLETNAFQISTTEIANASALAREEFDSLRAALIANGIDVETFEEPSGADTPDALFPNNWFASLPDGRSYLFPMLAKNRRREVHPEWIKQLLPKSQLTDLRSAEGDGIFLEGTGSLILDHKNRVGYACFSPRTQKSALEDFARQSGYEMVGFDATDSRGGHYYHTNVIMALGSKLAILCVESIAANDRKNVLAKLEAAGKQIVSITRTQVENFAGNMIELANQSGRRFWICSDRAWHSLTMEQSAQLETDASVIHQALPTIETLGGGGARCMIAELF